MGLDLFMKTVIDSQPWLHDPSLVSLPWRDDKSGLRGFGSSRKLKIGILWSDGVVKPHPPIFRALREVSEKLGRLDGIELVGWEPYKHDLAWEIIVRRTFMYVGHRRNLLII